MVEERQRQRQTPLARIENPGSNAMDNYYGFDRGLDVRNPQDLQKQRQTVSPNRFRANEPNYIGNNLLGDSYTGGIMQMTNNNNPESNFRILQQMSPTLQEEYQTADSSNVFDMYDQYKDKYGEFDFGDMEYSNSYEKEVGPGILGFDGSYDFDDNDAKMGINYSMSFDDGGIATLPETQSMQQPKVPMTDEQKDYLYDYMLDFMMKQRMKEQKEMEGKIPPFNYEGLEV